MSYCETFHAPLHSDFLIIVNLQVVDARVRFSKSVCGS